MGGWKSVGEKIDKSVDDTVVAEKVYYEAENLKQGEGEELTGDSKGKEKIGKDTKNRAA